MTNNITGAISAYQNAGNLKGDASGVGSLEKKNDSNETFAELIKGGIEQAVETQKASETVTADYMLGKVDINDVVLAVRNAEVTLNTVTAIRDRVVNAMQEIMRMPI